MTTPFSQLTMIFNFSIYIYSPYESTTRFVVIAGQFPALLNEMHFSVRQITSLCRIFHASRKRFHPFILHVRTNHLLNGPFTLGNDFFYSYASYRESTAVLRGPLNLTVSSHRTLSREIHFADHRSKPGIYGGCLGEVHLYSSFTVISDLLASNST